MVEVETTLQSVSVVTSKIGDMHGFKIFKRDYRLGDYPAKNHTYILNEKNELVGYIPYGMDEEFIFKSPMKQFSKARRKFTEIKS